MFRRLLSIYTRFMRIGAFTIGGGIVMLGVIESEVRATGEFSDEEITDMIVLATAVPGPIATNLSFVAGKAMEGWAGALAAVLGTATAPFLVILFLSSIIIDHLTNPWMIAFFLGASAGVIAVVWNSLWKMIKTSVLVDDPTTSASMTMNLSIGDDEAEGEEQGEETRKGWCFRHRFRVSLIPVAAFLATAWVMMGCDVHPFIALIIGGLISFVGARMFRKEKAA
ncbi:MAG: chromate transporter [Fretibacterium sp.]|nr:chromate transporter [Fretibacterium sp.]